MLCPAPLLGDMWSILRPRPKLTALFAFALRHEQQRKSHNRENPGYLAGQDLKAHLRTGDCLWVVALATT
jgi:hypothetical protein